MVDQQLLKELRKNFRFSLHIPEILGIVLFGSHLKNQATIRSDIDICVVTENKPSLSLWNQIVDDQPDPQESYSIYFFHELPLYIKKDIFSEGLVIVSPDEPRLHEFFFPYRKIWQDEKYIMRNA